MTYIVTDACIKCKYMDCVEVCPVDCFYEGENMLVIHPEECIDCGVCEPECPVEAIVPDTEDEPDGKWLKINATQNANPQLDIQRAKYPASSPVFQSVTTPDIKKLMNVAMSVPNTGWKNFAERLLMAAS